jgi:hypothetical protein
LFWLFFFFEKDTWFLLRAADTVSKFEHIFLINFLPFF